MSRECERDGGYSVYTSARSLYLGSFRPRAPRRRCVVWESALHEVADACDKGACMSTVGWEKPREIIQLRAAIDNERCLAGLRSLKTVISLRDKRRKAHVETRKEAFLEIYSKVSCKVYHIHISPVLMASSHSSIPNYAPHITMPDIVVKHQTGQCRTIETPLAAK